MIKKIALIWLVHLLCSGNSSGQRVIDVRSTIQSPENGYVFYSPGKYEFRVGIINKGPDAIMPYDQYSLRFIIGSVITFPDFDHVLDTIFKGDTLVIVKTIDFDYGGSGEIKFCAEAAIFSSPGWDSVKWETDSMRKDNRFCYQGEHHDTSNPVGIEQYELSNVSIYPNPTFGLVKAFGVYDRISVYNLIGERLLCPTTQRQGYVEIDLRRLPAGIYVLKGRVLNLKVIKLE